MALLIAVWSFWLSAASPTKNILRVRPPFSRSESVEPSTLTLIVSPLAPELF